MQKIANGYQQITHYLKKIDFLPLLALRLYLAPIFIMAGYHKYTHFDDMVAWFGNTDWGLGLPLASLMVALTIFAELMGGLALLFGVWVRFFSLSLLVAMAVAMVKVHLPHGWHAITPTDPNTSIAQLFAFTNMGQASLANSVAASERLARAKAILQTHGDYDWLTQTGDFVLLNNGIEFGMTYFVMLFVLLCYGAGRYVSVDDWVKRFYQKRHQNMAML